MLIMEKLKALFLENVITGIPRAEASQPAVPVKQATALAFFMYEIPFSKGSANKTLLFQATPSVLKTQKVLEYLKPKIASIGTSACPPYHFCLLYTSPSPRD